MLRESAESKKGRRPMTVLSSACLVGAVTIRRKGGVDRGAGGGEGRKGGVTETQRRVSRPEAISERKGVTHNVRPLKSSRVRLQKPGRVGKRVGF